MNPHALLSAFLFSASAISCVTAAITASTAVDLAPTLLEHLAGLKDALETIRNNRIISAAIKMRSLLPNYAIEVNFHDRDGEDSSDSEGSSSSSSDDEVKPRQSATPAAFVKSDKSLKRSDSESSSHSSDFGSDSDIDVPPKSSDILISALIFLLKEIPSTSKRATLPQIASFDFAGPKSLDQFLAEKKSEAAQKLTESFVIIRQIQRVLDLPPQSSSSAITTKTLARIVAKLDALRRKYMEMMELKNLLKWSRPSARKRAKKAILKPRSDIEDIVQKLADILGGL